MYYTFIPLANSKQSGTYHFKKENTQCQVDTHGAEGHSKHEGQSCDPVLGSVT